MISREEHQIEEAEKKEEETVATMERQKLQLVQKEDELKKKFKEAKANLLIHQQEMTTLPARNPNMNMTMTANVTTEEIHRWTSEFEMMHLEK